MPKKAQNVKAGMKKKTPEKPQGLSLGSESFGKLMLVASNRETALRKLERRVLSPEERDVARTYWRETSRLRNRMDWAFFAQKNLMRDAVNALPSDALKKEATAIVDLPPVPSNLWRPSWRPPANKPASVP